MIDFDDLDTDPMLAPSKEAEIRKNAHIVNGGDAQFPCPSCKGKGIFVAWSGRTVGNCFKCKGTGKISKAQNAAVKAKATREQNLKNNIAEFIENNADLYEFIRKNADWSDFYRSMYSALQTYGRLTDGQFTAVQQGMFNAAIRKEEKRRENEKKGGDVDVSIIENLFNNARESGLKRLAFRANDMKISAAKETGRNPGALYVEHDGVYTGKIVSGRFIATSAAKENTLPKLLEIAADPLGMARLYGKQTGKCSCCGRELTDEVSVANGIGPICEANWRF